ncbi:MBL fold metallo-hydrolase, partial [bacterium]|nr:MBL fold metallo-hydrolase [bacterium]
GFARFADGQWEAQPSVVLFREGSLLILADPGDDPGLLSGLLEHHSLKIGDINMVIATHNHSDHAANLALFPTEKVIHPDLQFKFIPGTPIRIIHTPGHEKKHYSLVAVTAGGIIAVAGDLFWWVEGEQQLTSREQLLKHPDPLAEDPGALKVSRLKILDLADWIIPGHGRPFAVSPVTGEIPNGKLRKLF